MKHSEESNVIAGHALENEQNLRLATKVGLAFPTVKERIITEFLRSLSKSLESRLGNNWSVQNKWAEAPLKSGGYISAFKHVWPVSASIGMAFYKSGPSNLYFFVYLGVKLDSPLVAELREGLEAGYAHGYQNADSVWWTRVEERHRDWDTEDALVGLWHKDKALEYYASHIIKLCNIAEPFLDKICSE